MVDMAYKTYLRFKLVLKKLQEKDMSTLEIRKETNIPPSTVYKMINELQTSGVVKVKSRRFPSKGINKEIIWGLTEDGKASL